MSWTETFLWAILEANKMLIEMVEENEMPNTGMIGKEIETVKYKIMDAEARFYEAQRTVSNVRFQLEELDDKLKRLESL